MNEIEVCKQAIKQYGGNAQKIVAMEECSELIQAISKRLRGKEDYENNLEEEIADVSIMITQLMLMDDVDVSKVSAFKTAKLLRLEKILKED